MNTVQLRIDASDGLRLSLALTSTDEEAAERVAGAISQALGFGLQMAVQNINEELVGDDPVQIATRAYSARLVRHYLNRLQPRQEGNAVVLEVEALDHALAPASIALLLPAVQAAREAARRTQESNKLKLIGLAMHNYHDVHTAFPSRANYDDNGKPLLSWRVHLLPFLDEMELYNQFRLNEPWDSEHNLPLAERIPDVYRHSALDDPAKTVFQTLDGPGTSMEGTTGLRISSFTDGTSNTLLVLESDVDSAVVWTKPQDLPLNLKALRSGFGAIQPEGFQAGFADGSVRLIPSDIAEETLRRIILRNDGEIVGDF